MVLCFSLLPMLCLAEKKEEDYKQLAATVSELNITVDTTYIKKYKKINDYSLIGLQYGVAFSTPSFQPVKNTKLVFIPVNVGITYTHFCKLFGYMPYFGVQLGVFYTQDAYEFQTSASGYTDNIFGAYKATLQVLEVPALAYFHYDFWKMRIMANVGIFGGYRMAIHREYKDEVKDRSLENTFASVENRWDYGLKAGGGFAFIFDPVEIHITCSYKYSWSNLYQPNYLSKYYYKWAYPTNIVVGVGVHYQLTRRAGTTTKEIKQMAREEAERMIKELKEKQALLNPSLKDSTANEVPATADTVTAADSVAVSGTAAADSTAKAPMKPTAIVAPTIVNDANAAATATKKAAADSTGRKPGPIKMIKDEKIDSESR